MIELDRNHMPAINATQRRFDSNGGHAVARKGCGAVVHDGPAVAAALHHFTNSRTLPEGYNQWLINHQKGLYPDTPCKVYLPTFTYDMILFIQVL